MPESIDVIIACYNEAETIEDVILDHLKVLENFQTFVLEPIMNRLSILLLTLFDFPNNFLKTIIVPTK